MLTLVLLSFFCGFASPVFLRVGHREPGCFLWELPGRTRLVGDYWTRLYDERRDEYLPVDQDLQIVVEATDPKDELVLSASYGSAGRFTFTSRRPGEHQVCLQSNSSQRPLPAGVLLALHLDVRVDRTVHEQLTELQQRVRHLTEQVHQIQREMDHHTLRLNESSEVHTSIDKWVFTRVMICTVYAVVFVSCNPTW